MMRSNKLDAEHFRNELQRVMNQEGIDSPTYISDLVGYDSNSWFYDTSPRMQKAKAFRIAKALGYKWDIQGDKFYFVKDEAAVDLTDLSDQEQALIKRILTEVRGKEDAASKAQAKFNFEGQEK